MRSLLSNDGIIAPRPVAENIKIHRWTEELGLILSAFLLNVPKFQGFHASADCIKWLHDDNDTTYDKHAGKHVISSQIEGELAFGLTAMA